MFAICTGISREVEQRENQHRELILCLLDTKRPVESETVRGSSVGVAPARVHFRQTIVAAPPLSLASK